MGVWGSSFSARFPGSLWFVDAPKTMQSNNDVKYYSSTDIPYYQQLQPFRGNIPRSKDMIRRFGSMLHHFLTETNGQWLYRGCEDVLIHGDNVLHFLSELEGKHDPLTEPLIFGACIVRYTDGGREFYLHGGAGYVISRALAEQIDIREIVESIEENDDAHISHYVSDRFPGAIQNSAVFVSLGLSTDVVPCPPLLEQDLVCPMVRGLANKIAFWHHAPVCAATLYKQFMHYPSLPNDVYFTPAWHSKICVPENQTL